MTKGLNLPLPIVDNVPIEELWHRYKKEPTDADRNRLIEHYLPIVNNIANRIHENLPSEIEVEDLISEGIFGLVDAINKYDPSRGVKFQSYCGQRINGSIIDSLREKDWAPRLVRSREYILKSKQRELELELGRHPTEDELISSLEISPREYRKINRDGHVVGVTSLSRKIFETDSGKDVSAVYMLVDNAVKDPSQTLAERDFFDNLSGILCLSRQEQMIVKLYYIEEMTMDEIGTVLDLSESRVSQLHTSILDRARINLRLKEQLSNL
jgi:RNA polymerase sigma factor FliA